MSNSIFCDVKETFIGEYRDYEIYKVQQVEIGTEEPCGVSWYSMKHKVVDDKISTNQEWRIKPMIDYRLEANPKMFERLYREAREKRVA